MVDRLSPERRSALMSKVRGKNTLPEMRVRRLAHALGYRFRLHRRDLPGCPDLVFPARQKIIFVHGCFWHQHSGCKYAYRPKSRKDFWDEKLKRNVERDCQNLKRLKKLGWSVFVVWECETKKELQLLEKLTRFLGPPKI